MRVLIDADGCPVIRQALEISKKHGVKCIILCDTSHVFDKYDAEIITVSKGADSVDFALVNMIEQGDVVITQDYGLAAMCLARGACVLSQDGMQYTENNIDSLLLARHTAKKIRKSGARLKGSAKRTHEDDETFKKNFEIILNK